MKRVALVCLLGGCALAFGAKAAINSDENSYRRITTRNAFDLRDPPPQQPQPEAAPPPRIKIRLTGITTIFGDKRALLMTQEPPSSGKSPTPETSCILAAGKRQGAIEILDINEKAGTVRLINDGNISVIGFDNEKLPNAPANQSMASPLPGAGARPNYARDPSTEEQIILMEAQREANRNNPRSAPLPPTALTPMLQPE
jgi:hypothetical protein